MNHAREGIGKEGDGFHRGNEPSGHRIDEPTPLEITYLRRLGRIFFSISF